MVIRPSVNSAQSRITSMLTCKFYPILSNFIKYVTGWMEQQLSMLYRSCEHTVIHEWGVTKVSPSD